MLSLASSEKPVQKQQHQTLWQTWRVAHWHWGKQWSMSSVGKVTVRHTHVSWIGSHAVSSFGSCVVKYACSKPSPTVPFPRCTLHIHACGLQMFVASLKRTFSPAGGTHRIPTAVHRCSALKVHCARLVVRDLLPIKHTLLGVAVVDRHTRGRSSAHFSQMMQVLLVIWLPLFPRKR